MKIVCPVCQGTGVVLLFPQGLVVPKASMDEMVKTAKKDLCKTCDGTGEVESGFLATKLGLKKQVINEGT